MSPVSTRKGNQTQVALPLELLAVQRYSTVLINRYKSETFSIHTCGRLLNNNLPGRAGQALEPSSRAHLSGVGWDQEQKSALRIASATGPLWQSVPGKLKRYGDSKLAWMGE